MIRPGGPAPWLWLLVPALGFSQGCSREADDLREWRPSDHRHQTETPGGAQGSQAPRVTGSAEPPLPGLEEVTIATWRRNCVSCHGELGRGDGPQGPMVKARDLSDPAWQASVTDAEIAQVIAKGRGRMPAFSFPPATVEGLIRLARLFERSRRVEPPPNANPASSGSAP